MVLYVLPKETEDRIISNMCTSSICIIKGDCILNKDVVDSKDILTSIMKFEEVIDAYDGDIKLEAEYDY